MLQKSQNCVKAYFNFYGPVLFMENSHAILLSYPRETYDKFFWSFLIKKSALKAITKKNGEKLNLYIMNAVKILCGISLNNFSMIKRFNVWKGEERKSLHVLKVCVVYN